MAYYFYYVNIENLFKCQIVDKTKEAFLVCFFLIKRTRGITDPVLVITAWNFNNKIF